MPPRSRPRAKASPNAATLCGSAPNERVPMTVFRESSARSSTGAKSIVQPARRRSKAVCSPARSANSRSPAAPTAIIDGITSTPSCRRTTRPAFLIDGNYGRRAETFCPQHVGKETQFRNRRAVAREEHVARKIDMLAARRKIRQARQDNSASFFRDLAHPSAAPVSGLNRRSHCAGRSRVTGSPGCVLSVAGARATIVPRSVCTSR